MHVQQVPFPPAWDKDSDQESKLGPNSQLLKWPQQNLLLQTAPWLGNVCSIANTASRRSPKGHGDKQRREQPTW